MILVGFSPELQAWFLRSRPSWTFFLTKGIVRSNLRLCYIKWNGERIMSPKIALVSTFLNFQNRFLLKLVAGFLLSRCQSTAFYLWKIIGKQYLKFVSSLGIFMAGKLQKLQHATFFSETKHFAPENYPANSSHQTLVRLLFFRLNSFGKVFRFSNSIWFSIWHNNFTDFQ